MMSLINVLDIEKRHRRTLKNYNEARHQGYDEAPYSSGALILNYLLPLVIAIGVGIYFGLSQTAIRSDTLGVLMSVFAVFAGFFLNVLVLMYRIVKDESPPREDKGSIKVSAMGVEEMEEVLATQKASAGPEGSIVTVLPRQAYSNVSYSILICICALVILIITSLLTNDWAKVVLSTLIIFMLSHFVVTLLIVVKRMHAMLFEAIGKEQS